MDKCKEERSIVKFWNKHKKVISIVSGVIGVAGVCFYFGTKAYLNNTMFDRWLKNATLEELNIGRENIQTEHFNPKLSDDIRIKLWNLMKIIDNRIHLLEGGSKEYVGPAYHREHGYNLYKPD